MTRKSFIEVDSKVSDHTTGSYFLESASSDPVVSGRLAAVADGSMVGDTCVSDTVTGGSESFKLDEAGGGDSESDGVANPDDSEVKASCDSNSMAESYLRSAG